MTTKSNIMASLPNNLIMRIVREADGGLSTHKNKFNKCLSQLATAYANHIVEGNEMDQRFFGSHEIDELFGEQWYGELDEFFFAKLPYNMLCEDLCYGAWENEVDGVGRPTAQQALWCWRVFNFEF